MSHFAQVIDGIVKQIIVAEQDFINTLPDKQNWIQTSYNTMGNIHYGMDGKPDGGTSMRGNYAYIGGIYDATNDVFYVQSPYPSWVLNKTTWLWESPVPYPNDGKAYTWDENNKNWVLSTIY